jgi:hypothetical protein
MHFRSFPQLTILFRTLIVITTCITFGTLQETAFAQSSSCSSALCNSQLKLGRSDGLPVGRSTLKGMSGLAGPNVTDPTHNYFYAGASQVFPADGAAGYFGQYAPRLGQYRGTTDEHSLAELAVESGDYQQVVEVGWIVAKSYGDGRPHLFVFYWVDGKPGCYSSPHNWCGFVPYPGAITPGTKLPVDGKTHLYVIRFFQGNWWIKYDSTWIGYYPGTLWNTPANPKKFIQTSYTQWFGEIAEPKSEWHPCYTQMGNGLFGHSDGSAVINNTYFIVNGYAYGTNIATFHTILSGIDTGHPTPNSFTYGGPGDTNKTDCP